LVSDNLESLINRYLDENYISFINSLKISIFLIDALDEINQEQRKEVINKVEEFAVELDCPVVITSRKIDIIKNLNINIEKYELLPFKFNQVIKLCEKLVSDKECLGRIKKGLLEIEHQIPLIPLSLLLLIRIIEDRKEIPASIAEVYNRYFELVLGKWDIEKGLEILTEYVVLEDFISELAYNEFFSKNKLQITKKDFNMYCKSYAKEHGWSDEILSNLIESIKRAGILSFNKHLEFKHKTFLEYFIAKAISERREDIIGLDDFLIKNYFDEMWRDVIFYYIGLHKKIKKIEFLDKIFKYKGDDINCLINKFMVGRLLQAGWFSTKEIQEFGINKAIAYEKEIREFFLDFLKTDGIIPLIIPDVLLLFFSELSICSTFLLQTSKELLDKMIKKMDNKNIFQIFILLWILKDLTPSKEYQKLINKFFEKFDNLNNLDVQNHIRILLLMKLIEGKSDKIEEAVDKKLRRFSNNNPAIIQKFIPKIPNGFRKQQRKKEK
jgi:hypothetical protein